MIIDIEAEGERLANETFRHPSGMYLWTDLVGAIQTAISDERARNADMLSRVRKRLRDDLDSNVGGYASLVLRYLP